MKLSYFNRSSAMFFALVITMLVVIALCLFVDHYFFTHDGIAPRAPDDHAMFRRRLWQAYMRRLEAENRRRREAGVGSFVIVNDPDAENEEWLQIIARGQAAQRRRR